MKGDRHPAKHQAVIFGPAALLVILAFVVAYQFIKPAPPDRVVMATGSAEGAYHAFAQRYAERLGREGIELELRTTAGSVENLALLQSGDVELAFVQGGVDAGPDASPLTSLGSLYYEPLWLFVRRDEVVSSLRDLSERRVAVGAEGSGTRALASKLLQDNAVPQSQWDSRGGSVAIAALKSGQLDAVFLVMSADSQLIGNLLRDTALRPVDFARADAYTRRYRFLNSVTLPEGAIDLASNIPDREVRLLAPTANLVSDPDLHPAVIDLLLQAASDVHRDGGWFEASNEFPMPDLLAFPLNKEAARYYEHGPPFLQRYLPFWAASLVDRLKVMLLPLLVLLFPLIKVMPPVYNWRMRARVYRWYDELEEAENAFCADPGDLPSLLAELARIEDEVRRVQVPLSFTDRLYHLRQHIEMVRRQALEQTAS